MSDGNALLGATIIDRFGCVTVDRSERFERTNPSLAFVVQAVTFLQRIQLPLPISMSNILYNILSWSIGLCAGLYVLWKAIDVLDHRAIRRRAEARRLAGQESICKWGFNAEGELIHVRCKRTPDL